MLNMKSTSSLIKSIAITGLAGVFLFIAFGNQIRKHIDEKLFESTYQFFLITVIGGSVSLVYEAYRHEREAIERERENEREERERQREIQRNLRTTIISAYHDLKKLRRLLRAQSIRLEPSTGERVILAAEYNKYLEQLIDAELAIEQASRIAQSEPQLFHFYSENTELNSLLCLWLKWHRKLPEELHSVEIKIFHLCFVSLTLLIFRGMLNQLTHELFLVKEYLDEIINEYEESYRIFKTCSSTMPLSKLPKLLNFIGSKSEAKGSNALFWTPFHVALEILGKVLQK